MSDQDNFNEDRHDEEAERAAIAKEATIDFHTENWINAVIKSPAQSHGTFASVIDYEASKQRHSGYVYRKPTATDVFVERMVEGDFMERAAQILIDCMKGQGSTMSDLEDLFAAMAANYAEFQCESQIKD